LHELEVLLGRVDALGHRSTKSDSSWMRRRFSSTREVMSLRRARAVSYSARRFSMPPIASALPDEAFLDRLNPVERHLRGLLLDVELDAEALKVLGTLLHVGGKLVALPVGELLHLLERAVVAVELAVHEEDDQDDPEDDEISRREEHAGQYKPFPYALRKCDIF
jgi:hypothetical protein